MDLLTCYGSDSDGDDWNGTAEVAAAKHPECQLQETSTATLPSCFEGSIHRSKPVSETSKRTERGKRILRLNSVLPPEILERLTRSTVKGLQDRTYATDDSSSDDGDHVQESTSRMTRRSKGHIAGRSISSEKRDVTSDEGKITTSDNGIRSLLTDLGNILPVAPQCLSLTHHTPRREEKVEPFRATMIDTATVCTETTHVENDTMTLLNRGDQCSLNQSVDSHPDDDMFATHGTNTSTTVVSATIRRGTHAAPIVVHRTLAPENPMMPNQSSTVRDHSPMDHSHHSSDRTIKLSRKELQRELRAGNFDSLQNDTNHTTIEQSLSGYKPTEEMILASQSHQRASMASRVHLPSLKTYVPKEGEAVPITQAKDLTSKHKSKHQIHSLVASAVVLQAKKRQEVGIITKGATSRVDAKRKYGW